MNLFNLFVNPSSFLDIDFHVRTQEKETASDLGSMHSLLLPSSSLLNPGSSLFLQENRRS